MENWNLLSDRWLEIFTRSHLSSYLWKSSWFGPTVDIQACGDRFSSFQPFFFWILLNMAPRGSEKEIEINTFNKIDKPSLRLCKEFVVFYSSISCNISYFNCWFTYASRDSEFFLNTETIFSSFLSENSYT